MKRLISALLAIFTIATLICVPVVATEPDPKFWVDDVDVETYKLVGDGTQASPYLVSSATDLAYIAKAVWGGGTNDTRNSFDQKYFLQTTDIDLGGKIWLPIGGISIEKTATDSTVVTAPFNGNYDGNFHTVSNMTITDDTFQHHIAEGTKITTKNAAGTINYACAGLFGRIGHNSTTSSEVQTIKNLAVTGTINVTLAITGAAGIVSYVATPVNLNNLYSNVAISLGNQTTPIASATVGGIFGNYSCNNSNMNIPIKNCVAVGNITVYTNSATFQVGGLAGKIIGANVIKKFENCYYTGNVSVNYTTATVANSMRAAGIVGQTGDGNKSVFFLNTHMWGTVTVTGNAPYDNTVARSGLILGHNNQNTSGQLTGSSYLKPAGDPATDTTVLKVAGYDTYNVFNDPDEITPVATAGTVPFVGTTKFLVAPDSVVLRFAQERVNGDTMDVRFLGTGVEGTVSGFKVTATWVEPVADGDPITHNGKENVDLEVTILPTINADGVENITAQDLGGKDGDKILGCWITGVPTTGTVTFVITPYVDATNGKTLTVVYTDGAFTSATYAD